MTAADLSESKLHESVRHLILSGQNGAKWERRQHVRYPFNREVTINYGRDNLSVPAMTLEFSRNGVGLLHKRPFRTEETISMAIQYRCGFAVTLPMSCTWCRPCGMHWYISGSCFQYVDNDHQLGGSHTWDPGNSFAHTTILDLLGQNIEGMSESRKYDPNLDGRCEERYPVSLPVTVTPVGDDMKPVDETFDAITRDMSSRGLALFVAKKLDSRCKYLIVQVMDFDGQTKLDATMEVLRFQPNGHLNTVGGRFVFSKYIDHR